ncbi:hypothetical protein C8R44DRAFT_978070 [Mycena epipterygia]|nr:hypothetical protein C8R44DRAFT_978070 [Mycena epipterygia]
MQRAEMRPSPIIRARIFSYLYFGLRRFGMHKVVEFIPLLLHMSLLLFFAGLVAFLIPVNRALMTMTAILLGVIAAAYAYLTVLPIFSSDSPYRTALSNVVWGLFRRFSVLLHSRPRCNSDEESIIPHHGSPVPTKTIPTMVEIMTRDAVQKSTKRDERDARAIIWTVQSLTDDNELEPFVEALPELIWGPTGRRTGHDDMIKLLLHTGELRLVSRIEGLLRSCDTGLLPPDRETRRRIFCIKALWAIGYFSASNNSMRNSFPVFDPSILRSRLADTALVKSHLTSTYSLVRWNGFQSLSALIREIISVLENAGNSNSTRLQDPHVLLQTAQREAERQGYSDLSEVFSSLIAIHPVDTPVLFQRARDACITFDDAAYDILTEYLCSCATLEDEPYEFDATCRMMVERLPVPPTPQLEIKLKTSFNNIIDQHGDKLNVHREPHHIDGIVGTILKLLPESFDAEFARHVVLYLMCRTIPSKALYRGLGQCNPKFIGSLLTTSLASNARDLHTKLAQIFWFAVDRSRSVLAHFDEETLAAVSGVPHLFVSSCAVAVLKTRILMAGAEIPPDQLNALMDRLQIPNLAFDVPTSMSTTARWKEGLFLILMDFLEKTDELSMSDEWNHERAADVFRFLVAVHPWERVSHSLQRRFAAWFLKKVVALHTQLIKVILYWNNRALLESLDDHVARRTICEALNTYLVTFSDKQGESMLYNNILAWLVELDPLPSENIPIDPTALTAPITTTTSSGSHQSEKIDGGPSQSSIPALNFVQC